jgi:opacity protein-like surface antigen
VTLTGATVTSGTTTSDRDLQKSLVAGLKVGHYFETYRWFGLEAEVFHTSPHIKQGSLTTNEPGVGSTTTNEAGERLGVTAFAFNFLFRYPGEYFQPYFGIGPAVFRVRNTLSDTGITETLTSTSPGVNAEVGLRYLVTRHLALFGEWKFNYTQIRIKETSNFTGQNSIYQAQMFVFGIGYHF